MKTLPLKTKSINRPSLRLGLLFTLLTFACFVLGCGADAQLPQQLNPIQLENQKPGTTAWQLTKPADDRQIEGYASLTSVPVGGDIQLFVNSQDATYSLTIYRMGWYGGKGGRQVRASQSFTGVQQVTPTADPNTGVIECHWTNPVTIHVPTTWLSGIYLAKLHGNTSGKESYIIFTVRDSRIADIVLQQSVSTYQAYNPWPGYDPAAGGYIGQSLYGNDTAGRVSFNRPYGRGIQTNSLYGVGAGDFLTHDFSAAGLGFAFPMGSARFEGQGGPTAWEFGMLRWLEHQGYDVTYITDVDTHEDVNRLLRGKAFLSVGHDEYWSEQMRSNVLQARDLGVSLGFFSGNYMYIAVEFLPDSNGSADRTLALAPEANRCVNTTTMAATQTQCSSNSDCATGEACFFKQADYAQNNETEQLITGGMWDPPSHDANGDIVVTTDAPLTHWVFANTGLKVGDVIPGLIGYEYDVLNSEFPSPGGLQTLLHTQVPDFTEAVVAGPPQGDDGGISFPNTFDGKDFDGWYDANLPFINRVYTCLQDPIPPLFIRPPAGLCSNPYPERVENHPSGVCCNKTDWTMTIYQADSGAWVFNAATVQWSWGLDDYFTGLKTADGANNGPALRTQCGYPFFHPGLVSCRHPAVEQITRNVLNRFIGPPCEPPIALAVNTTADGDDVNPGDGICETAPGNGVCTLRAAIEEAQSGIVRCKYGIIFQIPTTDPGYNGTSWTITLATALPDLLANIEIDGPGNDQLIVQPGGAFRVFNVAGTATVTFFGLTIANGFSADGGGIQNMNIGTVNITNCTLRNNFAQEDGGGIHNNSTGIVNVTNSTLSGNVASGFSRTSGTGRGGGIFNLSSGIVNVTNSTLSGNAAFGGKGVIGGAGQGGGIYNAGNAAVVNVTNSTLSGNSAIGGPGINTGSGDSGGAAQGGGIFNSSGTVNVTNSTISGNFANGGNSCSTGGCGVSGSGQGGGIFNASNDAVVNVANSTLTSNAATDGNDSSHPNGGPGHGGGVFSSAGIVTVESDIIAGNSSTTSDADGNFTSNGFNLIGKNDGAAASFPAGNPNTNNDIVGTGGSPIDPKLDPKGLQNNGGPTQTIALLPGSPAIDKATSTTLDTTLIVDQRGVGYARTVLEGLPKPLGGDGTDIGAFELGAHISAASKKTHGPTPDPTKTFGIPLPLTGTVLGVEWRRNTGSDSSGPNAGRDHEVAITFKRPVAVREVSVASNNAADTPTATFSVSSNIVTVDLHNVPNARRLTLNLVSVSDGTNTNNVAIPMGVLLGDVNASKRVDAKDVSAVQSHTNQSLSSNNFRYDVDVSGVIDGNDVSITQGQTGTSIP